MGRDRRGNKTEKKAEISKIKDKNFGISKELAFEIWKGYQNKILEGISPKDIIHHIHGSYGIDLIYYFSVIGLDSITKEFVEKAEKDGN